MAAVIETVNRDAATPAERLVLTDPHAATTPVFAILNPGDRSAIRSLIADPAAIDLEEDRSLVGKQGPDRRSVP